MTKEMARVFTTEGKAYDVPYETDDLGLSDKDVVSIAQSLKIPEGHSIVRIEGEKEARIAQFPSASAAASSAAPAPPLASSPAVKFAPPPKAPAAMKFETNGELPKEHDKEWYPVVCQSLALQMVQLYGDPVTALAWAERHSDDWAHTVEYTNKQDDQKYPHSIGNIKNGVRAALQAMASEGASETASPEAMEYRTDPKGSASGNAAKNSSALLIGEPFKKDELEGLLSKLKGSPSKDALDKLKKTYPIGLINALKEKIEKNKDYKLNDNDIKRFQMSHFRFLEEAELTQLKANKDDPSARFLVCVGQATSTSNFMSCLTDASIPNMVDQKVIDDWKDSTITLDGEKKVIDDPEIDALIGAVLKRNGKYDDKGSDIGGKMANSFAQISSAIRCASDPEWIRARIKSLIPKDGVSREDIAAQTKYNMELQTLLDEIKKPDFTDKTRFTPTKIQMITRIMQAYFKVKNIKVKWDEAATYNAIALYKNVVAAYTHSTNGTVK